MRVILAGGSGLVGRALIPVLAEAGHSVVRLVRGEPAAGATDDTATWDPARGAIDSAVLEGADAVVCLSGASIADGRWSRRRKALLLSSRVDSVRTLAEAMTTLEKPPTTLVTASAIGFYGDRGDEELGEASSPGEGFLADVCRRWEAATAAAREAGVRTVPLRIGMVLAADGGALAKMLPPFRLGAGGPLGSGRQWVSWIALGDLVRVIRRVLEDPAFDGPINAVAPGAVRQRDFARTLGAVLGRPAILPAPAFALRLALGEMADELLLAGQRVVPGRLEASDFDFRWPSLESALRSIVA